MDWLEDAANAISEWTFKFWGTPLLIWLIAVIGAFAKRYYWAGWTALLAPFVWGIAFAFVGSACMAGDDICSDDGWRVVSVLFFVAWAVVAWAFVVAIVLPVRPIRGPKEAEPPMPEDSPPSPGESRN